MKIVLHIFAGIFNFWGAFLFIVEPIKYWPLQVSIVLALILFLNGMMQMYLSADTIEAKAEQRRRARKQKEEQEEIQRIAAKLYYDHGWRD